MLAVGIGQPLSQIGHRVVQRQEAHGQLGLLGLILLVFCRAFLGTPLVLLYQIHPVLGHDLAHPCLHHGVDTTLAAGKVAGDVADQVQRVLRAVDIQLHPGGQCPDGRTDGRHHRHRQRGSDGLDRIPDALRHLGQTVVVEAVILLHGLVQSLVFVGIDGRLIVQPVAPHLEEHILQPLGHLGAFLRQRRVDAFHLL